MKVNKIFGAVLMMVLVSACAGEGGGKKSGQGNVSMDAQGNCSSDFISAYNAVVFESKVLKSDLDSGYKTESEILHQVQVLKNACDVLFPAHDNVTCTAVVDYRETKVTSNELVKVCESAAKILQAKKDSN